MNTRLLIKEIDNLIIEGHPTYYGLCDADKDYLVGLYMESMGANAFECISESDDLDITLHRLKQFILRGSTAKAYELAETMRTNAEKYLCKLIAKLYEERTSVVEPELKREAGLKPYQHKDNGETTWMRA